MAISTGAALLGAAVIGGGTSILSGNAQKKAAGKAADVSLQAARENNAREDRIYNLNTANLNPWMQSGQTANNALMGALGFPQAAPSAFGAGGAAPSAFPGGGGGNFVTRAGDPMWDQFAPQQATGAQTQGVVPGVTPQGAFDTFRGSTGYQFRLNEGLSALQKAFGKNLESGAASKAALRFGQGIASDEFGRWAGMLGDQSRLGFGAASALAGVGNAFTTNSAANTNSAATAAANAKLYAGSATANMWNNIGSSFGSALGYFGQPAFGR